MTVPSSRTENYDELLTTTLKNYKGSLADNIYESNALLSYIMENGNVRRESGGEVITAGLRYGKNSTVQSYSPHDQLNTDPQDNLTRALYDWRFVAGSLNLSGPRLRKNSGEEQLFNLLEEELDDLEMALKSQLNDWILNAFDTGDEGENPLPLPLIVAKNPGNSSYNPVGGITGVDWSFWQNWATQSGATTLTQLKQDMRHSYNNAGKGTGGFPDLVLTDQKTKETYVAALDDQKRYRSESSPGQDFDAVVFKQADLIWDERFPNINGDTRYTGSEISSGGAYFINTEFFEMVVHRDAEFEPTDFKQPADQDAMVSQLLWQGAVLTNNRRKHAVLYDIDNDIV